MLLSLTLAVVSAALAAAVPTNLKSSSLISTTTSIEIPSSSVTPFSNMTNCTWGQPVDNGTTSGSWPILYELVRPNDPTIRDRGSYKVLQSWHDKHFMGTTNVKRDMAGELELELDNVNGPNPDNYQTFKCQYQCNFLGCSSFFAWAANATGQFTCDMYNEILDPTLFEPVEGRTVYGGFDQLCYKVKTVPGQG